mmetsp:Transcript_70891/g.143990  ORF Transcript_70891/g.143990 Transcript_70891/m.143990 type:complete len:86 (+) Transcript_70891:3786-4043(+)
MRSWILLMLDIDLLRSIDRFIVVVLERWFLEEKEESDQGDKNQKNTAKRQAAINRCSISIQKRSWFSDQDTMKGKRPRKKLLDCS